jgi:hypothetical protein
VLVLAAKFPKFDAQAGLMKSLIDAIGRERASTLMEQTVADAIRDNLKLGLARSEQRTSGAFTAAQKPSSLKQVPIA